MYFEHRLSALLQLHLHSLLNTWLQYIVQRQLQAETTNIWVLGFGVTYVRDFMVIIFFQTNILQSDVCNGGSYLIMPKSVNQGNTERPTEG